MQRIIERSETLYQKITFFTHTANLRYEEAVSRSRNGHTMPHLIVSIAHETEQSGVIMDWDCRTGDLIRVSNEVRAPRGEILVMRKGEAADATASWLSILGIASKAPQWKLTTGPTHSWIGNYIARWRGADREVTVIIQDQTGELIWADIRHLD